MSQSKPTDDIATPGTIYAELTRTPKYFPRSASTVRPEDPRVPPHIRFQGDLPQHQPNEF